MPDTLAKDTIARIQEALDSNKLAGVPEVVRLIQEMTSKAFSITVKELADLINRDITVSARVLSAANTLGYNPHGVAVSTITQAIHLIGFEKIRNLAISLMLIDNAEQQFSKSEQRETAAAALATGMIAQSIADKSGDVDSELAFVCASLRSYGALLMTTFLFADYSTALDKAQQMNEDNAFREVFGLTPLELSYHLLLSQNLPRSILNSMQKCPPQLLQQATLRPNDKLLALSSFSSELCALTNDAGCTSGQFKLRSRELAKKYGKVANLAPSDLDDVFKEVNTQMQQFSRSFGISTLSSKTLRNLVSRAKDKDLEAPEKSEAVVNSEATQPKTDTASANGLPPATAKAGNPQAPPSDAITTGSEPQRTTAPDAALKGRKGKILDAGSAQLRNLLNENNVDLQQAYKLALCTIKKALDCPDIILFLKHTTRKDYRPTMGLGSVYDAQRNKILIDLQKKDLLSMSVRRHEIIHIENAADPKLKAFIPPWLREEESVRSFLLIPIKSSLDSIALIFASMPQGLQLTTELLAQLKEVRQLLSQAAA